jgi:hypothetical protein
MEGTEIHTDPLIHNFGEWSPSHPSHFIPVERNNDSYLITGCVVSASHLDLLLGWEEEEKSLTHVSNQTLHSSACSLVTILSPLSQLPFNERYEKPNKAANLKQIEMAVIPFSKPFS